MKPSDSSFPKTRPPIAEELEDLYLAAWLNQKCGASTCSLPTDLVIWLLQEAIIVCGGSPDALGMKLLERRMGGESRKISKPTDPQE